MIIAKEIEINYNTAIEFGHFKLVFLPRLKEFFIQKETLKKQENKNEKAFESELKSFLKNTFYAEKYLGNRPYKKGEADLVIADNRTTTAATSVLIEVKSPLDKKDFITKIDLNKKAFQQAITYFLIEIIEKQNFGIRNILLTDTDTYYLFDSLQFHQLFYKSNLRKDFENWYAKTQSSTSIADFYQQIDNFLANYIDFEIEGIVLEISDDTILEEIDEALQEENIDEFNKAGKFVEIKKLYHFFSPYILQKEKAEKDNNELNYKFYYELLYILGLQEYQKNGIKLIDRLPKAERVNGSFIENTIEKIIFERPEYLQVEGEKHFWEQEDDFEIALELCIIWINRILFLKLLEGQLQSYHNDRRTFQFLTPEIIKNGNRLATLFFHVLNTPTDSRSKSLQTDFEHIPFLNSSLFQINYIEVLHGRISGLRDDLTMPLFKNTVLKDSPKELAPLQYLLTFLDAYNFGLPEKQEVQHKTKDLINASVLGKIFEKLNGYKDGSFYTPSYITMYMSRKVVRNAIINKFNEKYGINSTSFEDVKRFTASRYKVEEIRDLNQTINEITVCDPAVGSGHFLVSVLNELIAAKSELEILFDNDDMPLQYWVKVENDELRITHKRIKDLDFQYEVTYKHGIRSISSEVQKVQTTLFREKQTLIENCLYGVDVNPNSVQICRLRLWIELLKSAYYSTESKFKMMETLPNLEYKVVQGNSLIPVYENQAVLIDWKRKQYADNISSISSRVAIINKAISTIKDCKKQYFVVGGSQQKNNVYAEINRAKADLLVAKFEIEIIQIDKLLSALNPEQRLDKKLNKKEEKERQELIEKKTFLQKIKRKIDYSPDLGKPVILFDWNVDFAEVLGTFQNGDNGGHQYGFDIIIGNPPYIQNKKLAHVSDYLRQLYKSFVGIADISVCFFEKGLELLKPNGQLAYINSNKFWIGEYGKELREILVNYNNTEFVNLEQVPVFDEALVSTAMVHIEKREPENMLCYAEFYKEKIAPAIFDAEINKRKTYYLHSYLAKSTWIFNKPIEDSLLEKIRLSGKPLGEIESITIRMGVKTGFDEAFLIDEPTYVHLSKNPKNQEILKPMLRGKDIHRYSYSFKDRWLAFIPWHFPLHEDSTITSSSKKAEEEFEKQYPEIHTHFSQYKSQLTERSKAETGIRYEWYALQRFANSFYHFFEKEKLVWGVISGIWGFAYDDKAHFLSSASYFLISEKIPLKFLLALFNSRLFQFYFDKTGEYTAGGAYVLKKKNIERFIIPTAQIEYTPFVEMVDKIILAKEKQESISEIENALNQKVYELYSISADEQKTIDNILIKKKLK